MATEFEPVFCEPCGTFNCPVCLSAKTVDANYVIANAERIAREINHTNQSR